MLQTKLAELLSYSRIIIKSSLWSKKNFIIFTQARTGGMLLTDLLNCHPKINCEGEILSIPRYIPFQYLLSRTCKFPQPFYGCKIKIDELLYTQNLNPTQFITNLYRRGWKIIYLKREDLLSQSVSRILVNRIGKWHAQTPEDTIKKRYTLNPKELINQLEFRKQMRFEQEKALRFISYFPLMYERHLIYSQFHQDSIDKVFKFLNLNSCRVTTSKYIKGTPIQLNDVISNYGEIVNTLEAAGFTDVIQKHNDITSSLI